MNRNIRIARELVRIAKELAALSQSNYSITKSFSDAVQNPKKAPDFVRKFMPTAGDDDIFTGEDEDNFDI